MPQQPGQLIHVCLNDALAARWVCQPQIPICCALLGTANASG